MVWWWVYRQRRLVARGGGPSIAGQQWLGGIDAGSWDRRTGGEAVRPAGQSSVKRKYKFATIREK